MTEVLRSRLLPRGSQQRDLAAGGDSGLLEADSLVSHGLWDVCRVEGFCGRLVSKIMISNCMYSHLTFTPLHAVVAAMHANVKM